MKRLSCEVGTGFEPVYTALQAVASPLGHPTVEALQVVAWTSPSGRRDSNPRPSPWQGDALPTALRPLVPHVPAGLRGPATVSEAIGAIKPAVAQPLSPSFRLRRAEMAAQPLDGPGGHPCKGGGAGQRRRSTACPRLGSLDRGGVKNGHASYE